MIVAAILSLSVALYCYAISQLQQHGKLKWSKDQYGFWGVRSWVRKWKLNESTLAADVGNERFFGSSTIFVFLTDGYHFMQFMFFNFLSLSFALAIGFNWWLFLGIFIGVRVIHWSSRKILSK